MPFSPPVVGCFVKKGLQSGGGWGHGHPRIPLGYALAFVAPSEVEDHRLKLQCRKMVDLTRNPKSRFEQ